MSLPTVTREVISAYFNETVRTIDGEPQILWVMLERLRRFCHVQPSLGWAVCEMVSRFSESHGEKAAAEAMDIVAVAYKLLEKQAEAEGMGEK